MAEGLSGLASAIIALIVIGVVIVVLFVFYFIGSMTNNPNYKDYLAKHPNARRIANFVNFAESRVPLTKRYQERIAAMKGNTTNKRTWPQFFKEQHAKGKKYIEDFQKPGSQPGATTATRKVGKGWFGKGK